MARKFRRLLADLTTNADCLLVQAGTQATIGTPLVSVTLADDDQEAADVYQFDVSAVSGATCTVTVTPLSGFGPYAPSMVFAGVARDGSTHTVKMGLDFVVSASAANGNRAKVFVGLHPGSIKAGNPTGLQRRCTTGAHVTYYLTNGVFPLVAVDPGEPQMLVLLHEENAVGGAAGNTTLVHRPVVKQVVMTGTKIFKSFDVPTDAPDETPDASGVLYPVRVRTANVTGGAADVEFAVFDGSAYGAFTTIDVREVDDPVGGTAPSAGLAADGTTRYQVVEAGHPLEGTIFVLSTTLTGSSTANALVTAPKFSVVAPYNAGSPPATNEGWEDESLVIQASGEAAGVVPPGDTAPHFLAIIAPGGALPNASVQLDWQLEYDDSTDSAWRA